MDLERETIETPVEVRGEDLKSYREFSPSYVVVEEESFGSNVYAADCCRCNPQRC